MFPMGVLWILWGIIGGIRKSANLYLPINIHENPSIRLPPPHQAVAKADLSIGEGRLFLRLVEFMWSRTGVPGKQAPITLLGVTDT